LRVSEAWTIWGTANGVSSEAELLWLAQAYRTWATSSIDADPTIGCIVLRNIFFAKRGDEMPEPPNWARNIVTHTGYESNEVGGRLDTEYVEHAFAALQHQARVDFAWEPDLRGIDLDWQGPRYGQPVLVRPRMGQGHFKHAVCRCVSTPVCRHKECNLPEPRGGTHTAFRTGR